MIQNSNIMGSSKQIPKMFNQMSASKQNNNLMGQSKRVLQQKSNNLMNASKQNNSNLKMKLSRNSSNSLQIALPNNQQPQNYVISMLKKKKETIPSSFTGFKLTFISKNNSFQNKIQEEIEIVKDKLELIQILNEPQIKSSFSINKQDYLKLNKNSSKYMANSCQSARSKNHVNKEKKAIQEPSIKSQKVYFDIKDNDIKIAKQKGYESQKQKPKFVNTRKNQENFKNEEFSQNHEFFNQSNLSLNKSNALFLENQNKRNFVQTNQYNEMINQEIKEDKQNNSNKNFPKINTKLNSMNDLYITINTLDDNQTITEHFNSKKGILSINKNKKKSFNYLIDKNQQNNDESELEQEKIASSQEINSKQKGGNNQNIFQFTNQTTPQQQNSNKSDSNRRINYSSSFKNQHNDKNTDIQLNEGNATFQTPENYIYKNYLDNVQINQLQQNKNKDISKNIISLDNSEDFNFDQMENVSNNFHNNTNSGNNLYFEMPQSHNNLFQINTFN
ncbi:hypothetical protein PPERSA_11924 [Pseudocohnilembus persalinus]|uniref:Uncharacterized protein n=1 Tax=Pseudocohnilembus persalinus TaxID=266149 RepID=A0A0V0QKF9_PSEPJ|nr:hypothetical protein PPERSA_11924 [Pseudocohnilembus persalinus]|eukprot:KRX02584.1 hypothetical protein PPERSA_11924 [Pseudocohnilembus persalinus]